MTRVAGAARHGAGGRKSRSRSAVLAALLVLSGGACDVLSAPEPTGVAAAGGTEHVLSRPDQDAIRAGYRERLRLGFGSPFRLMDFALADPRLEPELRRETAEDLLESAARGEMYEVDPLVLLPSDLPPAERVAQAAAHLDLIERTVSEAADPRAGELTVRLAYRLAELEKSVQGPIVPVAVSVAALVRDRELAIADARRLLTTGRATGIDPVELVPLWRTTLRLMVERPAVNPLDERLQRQAIRSIPGVLGAIRRAGLERVPAPRRWVRFAEDPEALERLQAIADSMDMPPRASLVVPVRGIGRALPLSLDAAERLAWAEFEAGAADEESFASRRAGVLRRQPSLRTALAAATLYSAVGLRVFAQERVWYPGSPSPTIAQLRARHGIVFVPGEAVRERWIPFYTAALEHALTDLRRVLPAIGLYGLTIEIPLESPSPRTLASYRARTRVLQWPATTGPGTLAHEVAHDLDRQAAQRRNRGGKAYASEAPSPSLAAAISILTGPPVTMGLPVTRFAHARRPAEVVARAFDWFVVTRLGAMGHWNGALSSAQDEIFTGNGSLGPPGVSPTYAAAVIEVVRSIATIPDEHRMEFMAEYGPLRWPGPNALLGDVAGSLRAVEREVGGRSSMGVPMALFRAIGRVGDEALREIDALRCEGRLPLMDRDLHVEYRQLVVQAVTAVARAAAIDAARELAGPEAAEWMAGELTGLPQLPAAQALDTTAVSPELALERAATLEAIATEALTVPAGSPPLSRSGFDFASPASICRVPGLPLRFAR